MWAGQGNSLLNEGKKVLAGGAEPIYPLVSPPLALDPLPPVNPRPSKWSFPVPKSPCCNFCSLPFPSEPLAGARVLSYVPSTHVGPMT